MSRADTVVRKSLQLSLLGKGAPPFRQLAGRCAVQGHGARKKDLSQGKPDERRWQFCLFLRFCLAGVWSLTYRLARGLKRSEQCQLLEQATEDAEEVIRVYGEITQKRQLHNEKSREDRQIIGKTEEVPRDCRADEDEGASEAGEAGRDYLGCLRGTDGRCASESPRVQGTLGECCASERPLLTEDAETSRRQQLSRKDLHDVEELVNEVKKIIPPRKIDWLFKV